MYKYSIFPCDGIVIHGAYRGMLCLNSGVYRTDTGETYCRTCYTEFLSSGMKNFNSAKNDLHVLQDSINTQEVA